MDLDFMHHPANNLFQRMQTFSYYPVSGACSRAALPCLIFLSFQKEMPLPCCYHKFTVASLLNDAYGPTFEMLPSVKGLQLTNVCDQEKHGWSEYSSLAEVWLLGWIYLDGEIERGWGREKESNTKYRCSIYIFSMLHIHLWMKPIDQQQLIG